MRFVKLMTWVLLLWLINNQLKAADPPKKPNSKYYYAGDKTLGPMPKGSASTSRFAFQRANTKS